MSHDDMGGRKLLPSVKVGRRYDRTTRTITRWTDHPTMGFPQPVVINRLRFWFEQELDEFDARQRARGYVKAMPAELARARGHG